jgi:hypothetical protein
MTTINNILKRLTDDVWYNSRLDRNAVFRAVTLSSKRGAIGYVDYPMISYELPDATTPFLVLSLGVVPPISVGLNGLGLGWVSTSNLLENNTWFLCFTKGRRFNVKDSFIQVTKQNEVLIALDYFENQYVSVTDAPIYVRFYSNVFFNLIQNQTTVSVDYNKYTVVGNDITSYLSFTNGVTNPLTTLSYKNGLLLVDGFPDYHSLSVGDVLEYIVDPSISNRYILDVLDLQIYYSDLDVCNKLTVSLDNVNDDQFLADFEFYICGTTASGLRVGVYFPRLYMKDIRPLTYKDFGINAQYVQNTITQLRGFGDVGTLTNVSLIVFKRTSGLLRRSVNGSNHINDLMNLPLTYRRRALTNVNSNISIWKANTLEQCPYNQFIQNLQIGGVVPDSSGVYSRKELLGYLETPVSTGVNLWGIPPIGLQTGTFVMFDEFGKNPFLIPVDRISQGVGYSSLRPPIYLPFTDHPAIETVYGSGNSTPITLHADYDIVARYVDQDGIEQTATQWRGFTLTDNEETFTSTLEWDVDVIPFEKTLRTAADGIAFTGTFGLADIRNGIDVYGGIGPVRDLGMRSLLLWVNGDYLIYGLDYILYNGRIFISAKRDSWTTEFEVLILYTGTPRASFKYEDTTTFGFVKYNKILEYGRYDLLAYRNKLFFVDGALYTVDQINEKEGYVDVPDTNLTPFINGTSFAIVEKPKYFREDILDRFVKTEVGDNEDDTMISNYLSVLDPQPIPDGLIVIPKQYEIVSQLMNRLIYDVANELIPGLTKTTYTLPELTHILSPYMWYLHVDLTQFELEQNYIIFSPSFDVGPFSANTNEYSFLMAVNTHLLKDRVRRIDTYVNLI